MDLGQSVRERSLKSNVKTAQHRTVSISRTTWAMSAILLAVAPLSSAPGYAQAYQFVRVTCVPANGYLEIEYKTVEQEVQASGRSGGCVSGGWSSPALRGLRALFLSSA